MIYDLNEVASGLVEAEIFEDELQPYLEALEESSGVILLDAAPPVPCSAVGWILEAHAGAWFLSYDAPRLAVLKQADLYYDNIVYQSFVRHLNRVEPNSLTHFIEIELYKGICNDSV